MLVDTDIAIHLRDGSVDLALRVAAAGVPVRLSLVSVIELKGGIFARPELSQARAAGLARLLPRVTLLPFGETEIEAYAAIVRTVGFSRPRILDRLIAATALVHDLTLVTINGADFRDIPDLKLEIWPAPAQ